jgi:DNA-binding MarR family transcriptional regulator
MDTAVLSPSIVGQAEKAHGAVLRKVLTGTSLDEQQWITVQFADGAGGSISRGDLIGRVTAAAKFDPQAVDRAVTALIGASLLEQRPGADDQLAATDQLAVTPAGRELVSALRERIGGLIAGAYGSVPSQDLATAARVLVTITARLSAELAAS